MKNIKNIRKVSKSSGEFWKEVKKGEPISAHTTLGIGGPAKYFLEVRNIEKLKVALYECRKANIKYFVLGNGSNMLVSDEGFDGLIILNKFSYLKNIGKTFSVGAGILIQDFIDYVIDKGYAGIEKMSGIPGSVGGAIYGNAGAYGQTISDCLTKVTAFDGSNIKTFDKNMCEFGYRESVFKKNNNIIIGAEFVFERGEKEFLKKISLDTIQLRAQKYSQGIRCPGSYFKNIIASRLKPSVLKSIPVDKITYGKIPAGYLMESVGAKGCQKGNIKIAEHHGNLIVNEGGGTAKDFKELADIYAKKVKEKFGIVLEPEVQLLGFEKNVKKKR